MYLRGDRRAHALQPQFAAARGGPGRDRAGDVLGHLLPPLVPRRCCRATATWRRPRTTASARSRSRRRAARSSTATARCWSTTAPRSRSRSRPTELPPEREQRERGAAPALAELAGMSLEQIRKEIREQTKELPASPVTLKRDVDYDARLLPAGAPGRASRASASSGSSCAATRRGRSPPTSSATSARSSAEQLKEPRYQAWSPATRSARTGVEYEYDHLLRGVRTARPGSRSTPPARRRARPLSSQEAGRGQQPPLDARLRRPGGRRGGAVAVRRPSRRVRRDGRPRRRDPRPRLVSHLRPLDLHPARASRRPCTSASAPRRPARRCQPRDPGPLSDRLDVQADHRGRGARGGPDHARRRPSTTPGSITVGGIEFKNAGDAANGTITLPTALQVSSDVFFYKLGLEAERRRGPADPDLGREPRPRLARPASTCRPRPTGCIPTPRVAQRALPRTAHHRPPWTRRRQHQPLGRPGRPAGQPAADGGRLRDDRQRRQRRAPAPRRSRSRTRPAASSRRSTRRRARTVDDRPRTAQAILDGLHAAAMEPGGTSYPVFGGFPVDDRRQDGNRRAPAATSGPVLVRRARALPDPEVVVAVTIEEGGFGADAAAPAARQILAELLRRQAERRSAGAPGDGGGGYD